MTAGETNLAFGAEHPSDPLLRRKRGRVRHSHFVRGLADGAAIHGDPPEDLPGLRFNTLFHRVLGLLGLAQQERTSRVGLLVFLAHRIAAATKIASAG